MFAASVWFILVGVLSFIWAEREMRYAGEAVSKFVQVVAALGLFLVLVGICVGCYAQQVVENGCGSNGLGQDCQMAPGILRVQ